jgi:cell wall-associated NlpC family hydrolase
MPREPTEIGSAAARTAAGSAAAESNALLAFKNVRLRMARVLYASRGTPGCLLAIASFAEHNSCVKVVLLAAFFALLPLAAGAGRIPIIDGHLTGGNGFVMWSSVDTTTDARTVESGFSTHFDESRFEHGNGIRNRLARAALHFLGTPFVWGGTTPAGFDCSGFVKHVFALYGITLPRTADYQYADMHHLREPLHPGDLVFFQTYAPGASHVGIYLGDGEFIHSSRPYVHVSRLSDPYYAARYIGAASAF